MRRQRQLSEPQWPLAAARLQSSNWQNIVHVYLLLVVYGDYWSLTTDKRRYLETKVSASMKLKGLQLGNAKR